MISALASDAPSVVGVYSKNSSQYSSSALQFTAPIINRKPMNTIAADPIAASTANMPNSRHPLSISLIR